MTARVRQLLQRKFVKDTITLQIGKVGVLGMSLIASVVVPVLMRPERYGVWQLGLSLYGVWKVLNFTGLIPSAQTRLAAAVGAGDAAQVQNWLSLFFRVALLYCAASTSLLLLVRPVLANVFYSGDTTFVNLALLLSLTQPTELLFSLFIITFSSRRQMRHVAALQNLNQFVLVVTTIAAVLISPTAYSIALSRLGYSALTLAVVMVVYQRTRAHGDMAYPGLGVVLRGMTTATGNQYWRFGVTNALDKNTASLYRLLPIQITGVVAGPQAAGYVGLALNAITQQTFFTSAILDNMQAVVPQAVGRRDYAGLWRRFRQVMLVLTLGGTAFFGVFALIVPFVVPLLYGTDWLPVIPLLQLLAIFGVVTTLGGVFGPLYRAFDFVRGALVIKLVVLLVGLPLGWWLIQEYAAVGGVLLVNGLLTASVLLTAVMTLPELRARAIQQATA